MRFFLIGFVMCLPVLPSYSGILGFKSKVDSLCSPRSSILTKKILLALVPYKRESEFNECPQGLSLLISKCQTEVTCKKMVDEFVLFQSKENSNLIGE